jgi:hypothetical protein
MFQFFRNPIDVLFLLQMCLFVLNIHKCLVIHKSETYILKVELILYLQFIAVFNAVTTENMRLR